MKSKKRRVNKTEEQKMNDPDYLFNPSSKRYVKKNGAIAKRLLDTYTVEELDVLGRRAFREKQQAKVVKKEEKTASKDKAEKKYKISCVGRNEDSGSDWDSREGRKEEKEASSFRRYNIHLLNEGENVPQVDKDSIEINLIQDDGNQEMNRDTSNRDTSNRDTSRYEGRKREFNEDDVYRTKNDDIQNERSKSRRDAIEKIKQDIKELERLIPRERRIINYGNKKKIRKIDRNNKLNSKKHIVKHNKSGDKTMYVYTDGAVSNNLKRGNPLAVGGVGVYFGKNDERNISEKFLEKPVTNQRAEIWAIVRALQVILDENGNEIDELKIIIFTDSMYGMNVIMRTWKAKENIDLLKKAWALVAKFPKLEIRHIRAHTKKKDVHSQGNDMADRLAVAGRSK